MAKAVGAILLELREAAGLPRSEVARLAKIDPSQIWRLENPKTKSQPSFDLVRRVAGVLNVSLDQISQAIDKPRGLPEPTLRDQLDRIVESVEILRRELPTQARRSK